MKQTILLYISLFLGTIAAFGMYKAEAEGAKYHLGRPPPIVTGLSNSLDVEPSQASIFVLSLRHTWVYKQSYDLFLNNSIYTEDEYFDLNRALIRDNISSSDTIYLHLAGNGGFISGMTYLVAVLKQTGATIIPVIDGNISSCHAVLALSFDKAPMIKSYGYAYFHAVSSTNEEENICRRRCLGEPPTDRGIDNYTKCVQDEKTMTNIDNDFFNQAMKKVLSEKEMANIKLGYEVIVPLSRLVKPN